MRYADKPQVLKENRVQRLYRGGSRLDWWQGLPDAGDGYNSEEFIVSDIPYIGPGHPKNRGISLADQDGQEVSLSEMIQTEKYEFLGKSYADHMRGRMGVLARVGDSAQRLIIQCHPTDDFAKKYLKSQFGKTEAWYLLNLRNREGCCYAGLKKNVKKEDFIYAFHSGDSRAMLNMMHKVMLSQGDMVLIPSGMLHAMGEGITFLEFHQPCDHTLRFEQNYFGKKISQEELHCGLGEECLMECVEFETWTEEAIVRQIKKVPYQRLRKQGGSVECLLSHEENPCFRVDRAVIESSMVFCQSESSHCILIAAKGDVWLCSEKPGVLPTHLRQGRGAVIPSMVGTIRMEGAGAELLIGYPYQTEEGESYGLFI